MERYIQLERVGKGTYGVVHKAKDKRTNEIYALKTIDLDAEEGFPSTAIREIALLKYLHHANIVLLHDVVHMSDKLTMVFEFLDLDLKKYLDLCPKGLEIMPIKSLLYQLLLGINYCHKQMVLHRDLKPANLLLNKAGILKLGDFGLARTCAIEAPSLKYEVITLWYRSPELLLGSQKYGSEIDIWSIGCIFAEMLKGTPLFPGATDKKQIELIFEALGTPTEENWPDYKNLPLYNQMCSNIPYSPPQLLEVLVPRLAFDKVAADLLKRLLVYDPKKRITAEEALSHPFFHELRRKPRRQSNVNKPPTQENSTSVTQ